MKRKTNLFYTQGPDSKFITFSNYTECLTGNFLSLETKLFSDKFLCLKINNLNSNTKIDFIKYLASYYENKLAMLRDHNINNNSNIENNIYPLAYLLEAILNICSYDNEEWYIDEDKLNSIKINNYVTSEFDFNEGNNILTNLITYVGEITEQDYNGIYSDTICSIDLNMYNEGNIVIKDYSTYNLENKLSTTKSDEFNNIIKLYGWEDDNLTISDYDNVQSIYDNVSKSNNIINGGTYNFNTLLSKIELHEIKKDDINYNKTLRFNILIPLFNLVNKNINHDNWSIYNEDEQTYIKYIDLSKSLSHIYDVPFGMWINGDEESDTFIELKKDISLNMYPSWSLLISSQFKPFPYSNQLIEENYSKESILHAHATYAEILSKLNNFMDSFSTLNNGLNSLANRVERIEELLKDADIKDTVNSNISKFESELIDTKNEVKNDINNLKETIYGYIDNIRWSDNITLKK